ncbi:MAG: FIST C-terminal domain-containing protein [Acidaminococcales bacterium]|jgi:hypothetical protein|nr:FIST C-terminal domain-containing protein [Acidaminococcales bacterium]
MLKTAAIFTYELDDAELALSELREQLKSQIVLMKNTVGILMCDPEFIRTGMVKAVCAGLPFPIAGATTMAQSINGETGRLVLTLMVLTSDDVFFSVGASGPINKDNILAAAESSYAEAAKRLGAALEMILLFPPQHMEISGNRYLDAYTRLCPNTPVFGTFAVDDLPEFTDCLTISEGNSSKEAVSFILVGGNVAPRFFIATISGEKMLPYGGEITKSKDNVIMEINDMRAYEYFESIGLAKEGALDPGLQFLPFVLDFKGREDYDAVPVVYELIGLDENGFAVCRGDMYQNSTFKLGIFESEDILATSKEMIKKINAEKDIQALIIFSCLGRRLSLGAEPLKELNLIAETINSGTPYMVAYSGGEICPTSRTKDSVTNRYHNYSLVACIL